MEFQLHVELMLRAWKQAENFQQTVPKLRTSSLSYCSSANKKPAHIKMSKTLS